MIREDKELYRKYLPKGLPIYYQPDFLDVVDDAWTALIGSENDVIQWLLPCNKRTKLGVAVYGTAQFAPDNSPILLEGQLLKDGIEIKLPGFYRFTINDRNNRITASQAAGFTQIMRNRQVIGLTDYPTELSEMVKRNRQNIRKAMHLKVVKDTSATRFYSLHESTFKRRKIEQIKQSYFERVYESLKGIYDTEIFILEDEDGVVYASNWVVTYEDTVYGFLRAKNYEVNQRGAQEYLMWEVIQEMRSKYRYWDLGGSDIPGVRQFNLEMGAKNIEYSCYIRYQPTWLKKILQIVGKE